MKIRIPWFRRGKPTPAPTVDGGASIGQTQIPDNPEASIRVLEPAISDYDAQIVQIIQDLAAGPQTPDPAVTPAPAPDTDQIPIPIPIPMEDNTPMAAAAAVPLIMAGLQVAPTVVSFIQDLIRRAEVNKPQPGQGQSRKAEVSQAAQRWAVPGELPAGATSQQLASLVQAIFDRMNQAGEVNRPPAQVVHGAVPGAAANGVEVRPQVTGPNGRDLNADSLSIGLANLMERAISSYLQETPTHDSSYIMLTACRIQITELKRTVTVLETKLAEALSTPQQPQQPQ